MFAFRVLPIIIFFSTIVAILYHLGVMQVAVWIMARVMTWLMRVSGAEEASKRVGHLVVDSRLPSMGAMRSDSYEGDGYVIVRDPDVEVVKAAMTTVIETIQIEYG